MTALSDLKSINHYDCFIREFRSICHEWSGVSHALCARVEVPDPIPISFEFRVLYQ